MVRASFLWFGFGFCMKGQGHRYGGENHPPAAAGTLFKKEGEVTGETGALCLFLLHQPALWQKAAVNPTLFRKEGVRLGRTGDFPRRAGSPFSSYPLTLQP
jgi:hypothetical protein